MVAVDYILEPFLHFNSDKIYNPLTDDFIARKHPYFELLGSIRVQEIHCKDIHSSTLNKLIQEAWIIPENTSILTRYRLKVVTLEGTAHCNQRCNFCPVSISPKDVQTMSLSLYESIVRQLADFHQIEGVFMINYNEPTLDRYFLDRIKILKKYRLPVCINTNGSGLTPHKIDTIKKMGGLRFISVNLSSLDENYYQEERQYRGLSGILKNLDYLSQVKIADEMVVAVLGEKDLTHEMNFKKIQTYFRGSELMVKSYEITNRAGCLEKGRKLDEKIEKLAGCDLLGSRPIQHLHINSYGKVFICCQDYYEQYILGDLTRQTVSEVLVSPEMQEIRAKVYGLKEASDDFICRQCVFALGCDKKLLNADH